MVGVNVCAVKWDDLAFVFAKCLHVFLCSPKSCGSPSGAKAQLAAGTLLQRWKRCSTQNPSPKSKIQNPKSKIKSKSKSLQQLVEPPVPDICEMSCNGGGGGHHGTDQVRASA